MLSVNFQKFYLFGVFWTERHYDQHNIIVDMQVKPTTFEVSSEHIQVCHITRDVTLRKLFACDSSFS